MSLHKVSIYLGFILLFINLLLFFRIPKKRRTILITWYLLGSFVVQMITSYYATQRWNNLFLSHYYFIGQFGILSVFYLKILKIPLHRKTVVVLLILVFLILCYLFIKNPKMYNQFSLIEVIICSLPLVLFSLFYFFESFGVEHKKYLFFNAGVFFYLLSSTLIFSAGNFINASNSSFRKSIWTLNSVLYVVYQLLILLEWYKNFRKPSRNSLEKEDTTTI